MMRKCKLILVTAFLMSTGALAQSEPFQLSLTPDIAIHDSNVMIKGLTLSVWGENPQEALALGIVNGSTGNSAGFSLGLLMNYADSYKGVQWGLINYTKGDFLGWQDGFINYVGNSAKGLQTGAVNYARELKGVQFGLANFAEVVDTGIQIGFINVIRETQTWFKEFPDAVAPAMILVNWRF